MLTTSSLPFNLQPSSEGATVQFKAESLIVNATLVSVPHNCLTLKLQPTPDFADRWTPEELQVRERFVFKLELGKDGGTPRMNDTSGIASAIYGS